MTTIDQFRAAFITALRTDPPILPDSRLTRKSFGPWLDKHFSVADLMVLLRYENAFGEEAANKTILDAFEAAGLVRPTI